MKEHVTVVGILHLARSVLGLLFVIVVLLVARMVLVFPDVRMTRLTTGITGLIGMLFVLALSVPEAIGTIFLMRHGPWARYLLIFYSELSLFNITFGTAMAFYSLWVLTKQEIVQLFGESSGWRDERLFGVTNGQNSDLAQPQMGAALKTPRIAAII